MDLINELFFSKERKLVDKNLLRLTEKIPNSRLQNNIIYHLKIGKSYTPNLEHSKRLRSYLCFLIGKENGFNEQIILPFATTLELIHNSTLIIDDIQDNDSTRCGELALWKVVGIAEAVNAGYYLSNLGQSYLQIAIRNNNLHDYTELLNRTFNNLLSGQQADIDNLGARDIKQYKEIAIGKTGSLLKLCLCFGSMPFQFDKDKLVTISEFSDNFSCYYQLRDDYIDIISEKENYDFGHINNFKHEESNYTVKELLDEFEIKTKQSIQNLKSHKIIKSEKLDKIVDAFKLKEI